MSSAITYTLKEKIVILDKLQGRGSASLREVAQGLGVPFTAASKIWKERQLIKRSWSASNRTKACGTSTVGKTPKTPLSRLQAKNPKRLTRTSKRVPEVEAGVLGWYQDVMRAGGVVTEGLIQQQASSLAGRLGLSAFNASTDWLSKFTSRNKVDVVTDSLMDSLTVCTTPRRKPVNKALRSTKRRLNVLKSIQEKQMKPTSNAPKLPQLKHQSKTSGSDPKNTKQSFEDICSALKTLERWVQANQKICTLTSLPAIRQDMKKVQSAKAKRKPKFNLY